MAGYSRAGRDFAEDVSSSVSAGRARGESGRDGGATGPRQSKFDCFDAALGERPMQPEGAVSLEQVRKMAVAARRGYLLQVSRSGVGQRFRLFGRAKEGGVVFGG